MKTLGIIGGGASGLFACIHAANILKYNQITLYERKESLGKKILATGNGRCNLTNTNAALQNYYGKNPNFAEYALDTFSSKDVISCFKDLGMYCKHEYGGRVFPYSYQSSTVLDVLYQNIYHKNINVVTSANVMDIKKLSDEFHVYADIEGENKIFKHDKIIIACGGNSNPNLGSNGSGFNFLEKLNHNIIKPVPVLSQLKTVNKITKPLNGVKVNAQVSAYSNNEFIGETNGEVLFTNYGLSGTAILDISKFRYENKNIMLRLDLMNEFTLDELTKLLFERQHNLGHLNINDFLVGLINKKVGLVLAKHSGIENLSINAESLTKKQIIKIAENIKKLEIEVLSDNGWENSQVTAGGADTLNFDEKTMESKIISGLYAVGEVLDIFGDCGGYNLQWAWSSGYLGGISAALSLL